jgi:hypothetical protein
MFVYFLNQSSVINFIYFKKLILLYDVETQGAVMIRQTSIGQVAICQKGEGYAPTLPKRGQWCISQSWFVLSVILVDC